MGLWRNALLYLGFLEDDFEEGFAGYERYEDVSEARVVLRDPDYEPRAPQQLASVHRLPVRQTSPQRDLPVIWPKSYADVQRIGDSLRSSLPVIVNLEGADGEFSKRVIAFACGIVYALDGDLKKLGRGIYLLSPRQAEPFFGTGEIGREGLGL